MALDLQNKSFHLLGRFRVGNHAELTKHIESSGGKVCKDLTSVGYIVADSVPAGKKLLVDDFEKQGGLVVTTRRVLSACSTVMDEEEQDDQCLRSSLKLDCLQDKAISDTSNSCSKKRSRSVDDGNLALASTSTDPGSKQGKGQVDKRVKTDSGMVHIRAPKSDPWSTSTNPTYSSVDQSRLRELVVPLDSCYCGARTDKVLVDDVVWDATLSLTDITKNNNKFYIIQVTSSSHGFYCFTRWGRVGTNGAQRLEFCLLAEQAKSLFHKKFRDKTKRHFLEVVPSV